VISDHPLSEDEFRDIYKKVPRLTVEILLEKEGAVFLTLRDIEPCKGIWHMPGGTVRFGEKLTDAVTRVAEREIGIYVQSTKLLGYIEYPSHYEKGLDSPVGIAFRITRYDGEPGARAEAKRAGWFKGLPEEMHAEQREFINSHMHD
jgi:ADP-ribose pyrophosphatase YjhB (NUDIX family)